MTDYIPCHVLFQNPSQMEMDLTTFASCCAVDKEWRSFFRTLYPDFVSEQFTRFVYLTRIHITETNTGFILPTFMTFLERIERFMQYSTIDGLMELHKMHIFKNTISETNIYNTCKILLNILEYSVEISVQASDMICFRSMLSYKIYQLHEYIFSASFETYTKNNNYMRIVVERGRVIETQLQKEKAITTDVALLQLFADLERQIRYVRRILR